HPLAYFLALLDARERMQHVEPEPEGDGEDEFPVLELEHRGERIAVRRAPVHEYGELARGEPFGERAAQNRGDARRHGARQADRGKVGRALPLRRELEAEIAGRESDAA